jgi:hypothetical protein
LGWLDWLFGCVIGWLLGWLAISGCSVVLCSSAASCKTSYGSRSDIILHSLFQKCQVAKPIRFLKRNRDSSALTNKLADFRRHRCILKKETGHPAQGSAKASTPLALMKVVVSHMEGHFAYDKHVIWKMKFWAHLEAR